MARRGDLTPCRRGFIVGGHSAKRTTAPRGHFRESCSRSTASSEEAAIPFRLWGGDAVDVQPIGDLPEVAPLSR
jgi:hypothetical protein